MELNQHIFCAKCLQKQKVMLYIQESAMAWLLTWKLMLIIEKIEMNVNLISS